MYLGETHRFVPRVPVSRCEDEDSVTMRVCVASTYRGCIEAMTGQPMRLLGVYPVRDMYVYRITSEAAVKPTDDQVLDQYRTGEHWLMTECVGVLCDVIPAGMFR